MQNIHEILKGYGLEIPSDKKAEFDKVLLSNYKTIAEVEKISGKLSAAEQQLKDTGEQLTAANNKIAEFGEMDIEGIRKAADEWKEKAEQAERDAQAKIAEMEHDGLLREKLSGVKFTSEYAKKGVFDEIKAKGLKVENGQLLGFDDVFSTIRDAQPSAFEPDTPPPQFGAPINPPDKTDIDTVRAVMGLPPTEKG